MHCKQNTICIIGCPVRNLIDKDENGLFDRNYMCGYYKKISKLLYDLLVIKKLDPSLFTRSNGRHVNYQIIDFSNEENAQVILNCIAGTQINIERSDELTISRKHTY